MKKDLGGIYLVIAATIIAGSLVYIGQGVIDSNKNNQQTSQGITNTISVVGEGKSSTKPDTLQINISISETGSTSKIAQQKANEKADKIQTLLAKQGVDKKDIKTVNLNNNPEYTWENNTQKAAGYRSSQSIQIQLQGDQYINSGNAIIDQISDVGVNIDNTSFVLKNQKDGLANARQNALEDAKAKAEQLAKFSGVKLGKPVMISDSNVSYNPTPMYYAKAEMAVGASDASSPSANISAGQTEVSMTVNVVFEIK